VELCFAVGRAGFVQFTGSNHDSMQRVTEMSP
jgi:hypothetical protein